MVDILGLGLAIYALCVWAMASLVYKWGLGHTEPKANLYFRLCCVTIGTLIFTLIFGNIFIFSSLSAQASLNFILACIVSGLSVTVGDLFYYMALKRIDASRAYPLIQLSLVFVYPFAYFLFGEAITPAILIGAAFILSSVFLLSMNDTPKNQRNKSKVTNKEQEKLTQGIIISIIAAFLWALSVISFNYARIISSDVFSTNFFRVLFSLITFSLWGIFKREYYGAFKKENKKYIKYYIFIGIAGMLSLGFADTLYYKAVEINGLVLTTTFTVNTPMLQQILSILILKEKFRKRFIFAVGLIIMGNYIILFL
ncbi:MAG: GRP family sugar transporter [Promethearchaeota archaeon]